MDALAELKKGNLQKKDGNVDLDNCDFIGLYFSAHWCPPCRGFTPELAAYYNDWQAANADKKLEIVFISSDRDQSDFDGYFKEMPWAALDFSAREAKQKLSENYGVRGIPTLVILDKTGATVSTNGRGQVMSNKGAKKFSFDKD